MTLEERALPATVVIRAASERTEHRCRSLVEEQIQREHVFCIHEEPFNRAVLRTFEIGLETDRKWTIAVDADVLIRSGAIAQLVAAAEGTDANVFEAEGRIFDKIFHGPRSGGLHLYRTSLLERAVEIARHEEAVLRPESHVIQEIVSGGFEQLRFHFVLGVHDFEQYYRDLYRKGFVHAQKFAEYLRFFEPMWRRLAEVDDDFRAFLLGMEVGRKADALAQTDASRFRGEIEAELHAIGLHEKPPLPQNDARWADIAARMKQMRPTPEFRSWERWLLRKHLRKILRSESRRMSLRARYLIRRMLGLGWRSRGPRA